KGHRTCSWLLSDGRFQGYNEWQPYGCMIHKYSKGDFKTCMQYISYWGGRNHFAFVGDSRIRQLYFEFIQHLTDKQVKMYKAHTDLKFSDKRSNILVEFFWNPYVDEYMRGKLNNWVSSKSAPQLVVIGSATWSIKLNNGSEEAIPYYKSNISETCKTVLSKYKKTTKVIWMLQDHVVESKLSPNRSMITNKQIDLYNRAAVENLSVLMMMSMMMMIMRTMMIMIYEDGLHISTGALQIDTQILFNLICNNYMNFDDGSCCTSPENPTTVQIAMAAFFATSLAAAVLIATCRRLNGRSNKNNKNNNKTNNNNNNQSKNMDCPTLISCIAKLGLILLYFFICDRTTFFMKENKYYTHVNFFLPFTYLMILGLFFTESTKQVQVLNRCQTDEWKGWMQIVILIYHLTGASKVLSIYMHIRVMVSAYLFLSAYGHFVYFFNKNDFSFHRLCTVLVRFNLLVVLLCLSMNRPYQFYYFVPLVTFWFIVIFIVMALPPRSSSSMSISSFFWIFLKIVGLAVVVTLLYSSEVFFDQLFLSTSLKPLFVTSDESIHDWRFRWNLDRYSSIYGLLFALALVMAKRFKLIDDSVSDLVASRKVNMLSMALSICGLVGYAVFTSLCNSKEQCNNNNNKKILSYICLRNMMGCARRKFSAFFAWFGKMSLELFIAQYHIWLAADTHGILVLIPSYPVMNLIVTSFVFVCVAHEIKLLTSLLTPVLVPRSRLKLARNVLVLLLLLLIKHLLPF
ncbi:hypothetical protein HELRODRAFT_89851, partial [Helobdella robusta]|uniref:Cas1p 10 TM acyl transferase domain-containing protein n=1 Tax=Helobdella robusta TaxID=6412 RepID=T1G7I3_HELRO